MDLKDAIEAVGEAAEEWRDAAERVADAICELKEGKSSEWDKDLRDGLKRIRKLEPDRSPCEELVDLCKELGDGFDEEEDDE